MIDKIQQHFGFTQMPFGRDLAPAMLHRHDGPRPGRRPHHLDHHREEPSA